MFSAPVVLLALASSALANVFTTSPVASTTFTGGQQATINWQDDGAAPSLASFGPAKVSIYVGNAQQQTQLQLITASVDVSTTASIQFTPDGTIGPNGNDYFVRFESLSLKDAASPQYPALAFSAKFTMASMTGTFNTTVQAQIDGQSTAPLAGQTSVAASGSASAVSASATSGSNSASLTKAVSASKTATGSAAGASKSASTSGALSVKAGWAGALIAALVGVSMF